MKVSYQMLRVLREFLINEDPQCGAEILRTLNLGNGTIYPMLALLKKEGWIELVASMAAPNEPTAHFYRITDTGRAEFLEMLVRLTIPNDLWSKEGSRT